MQFIPYASHPNLPASVISYLESLVQMKEVERLVLFGSRAFSDHEPHSDVDLAVCGALSDSDWRKVKRAASEAASLYWISVVRYDSAPSDVQQKLDDTGCLIYVRP